MKTDLPTYIKLDKDTRPQDDFYSYVCQRWLANNPLPPTKTRWGIFDILNKKVEKQLQKIIEDWRAAGSSLGGAERQVITYYQSLIDKDDCQKNSLRTLQQSKRKMETVDAEDGSSLLAELFKLNIPGVFTLNANIDLKDSSRFCLAVKPSPLDLPNRDYYLSANEKMKATRRDSSFLGIFFWLFRLLLRSFIQQEIKANRTSYHN